MKTLTIIGAFVLTLGVAAADTGPRHQDQEMTCRFGDKKSEACIATYHPCPPALSTCRRSLEVVCGGERVAYDTEIVEQVISQNGIGFTTIGTSQGLPYLAVDEDIYEPFDGVFAHLYLSRHKRLAGLCWSNIERGIE